MILGPHHFHRQKIEAALKWRASIMLVKLIWKSAYDEFKALGTYVTAQDVDQLK